MQQVPSFFESPEYLIATGCLFLGIGLYYSISPIRTLFKAQMIKTWPQVDGTIVKSEIASEKDDEGTEMYYFDLQYEYIIEGKRYCSRGRFLNDEFKQSWTGKLNEIANEYPLGGPVKVFYNERDCQQSTVVSSVPLRYYLPVLATASFCVIGLLAIFKAITL